MSGRIFQNVVLQIKDATDRVVGVIDAEGTVISCSDLGLIGRKWPEYTEHVNRAEGAIISVDGRTFHALGGWGSHFDYAVFTMGDDDISHTVCSMASVALNGAKSYYEEKHDRGSFIKNIILDNIMLSDICMRAKELHVAPEVPRSVFLIRQTESGDAALMGVVQGLFPDRQNDFVLNDPPAAGDRRRQGGAAGCRPAGEHPAGGRRGPRGDRHRHCGHASAGLGQKLQGGPDRH